MIWLVVRTALMVLLLFFIVSAFGSTFISHAAEFVDVLMGVV